MVPSISDSAEAFSLARLTSTAVLLLFSVWLARSFQSWRRLRHIPGPPLASVSMAWMAQKVISGRFHEHMCLASEQYGPLVRIGPNTLLCADPDTLRRMSSVRSLYTKGTFYESGRIIPGHDNIVSLRDEVMHKALRSKMAGAYSANVNLEAGVDRQLQNLVALIDAKYLSDNGNGHGTLRPFDLSTKSQFFALDVVSDVSFSGPFGFLTQDKDLYDYVKINDSAVPVMNLLQAIPGLTDFVYRWPMRLALPGDGDEAGFGRLMGLAKGCVEERLRPGSKPRQDMLQAFIDGGMTYDELIQHMFVQIVAGSITTAAAIRHTFAALLSTPTTYTTLQKEIDTNIASGRISSPTITDAEAQALPYLQAVICEGMRMWPPTTGLGCKQVPPGGDVICGYHIPAGTQVGHNFGGTMRLKSIWGEDADLFRPERWIVDPDRGKEEEEDRLRAMQSVLELEFGSGKYGCFGKRIALMELNKIFVEMLRRYDFAAIDPLNPIKTTSGIFWTGSDQWLRVTKR
ncbi:cytochrome P450 [Cercophora scortea]|uniref:Cytochrome P450 n=1 Tax=Cercophora scortea TaxID=314031 RepID=A0AAE0M5Y2_9PEZI|nr:cytochrome P450 [Cercophora scortea]